MKLNEVNTPWEKHKAIEYAKDGNTVVRRNRIMHRLEDNYYSGEITGENDSGSINIYVYYPEPDIALYLGGSHESNDTEYILEQCRKMNMETPEQLVGTLDKLAEQKKFIKDIWIEIAAILAPEKIPSYRESKAAFLEEQERNDRERRAEIEAQEQKRLEELQKQTEEQLQAAVNVMKNGGRLINKNITIYKTINDSKDCAILNYLARKYGVNIPIKTQGCFMILLSPLTIQAANDDPGAGRLSGKNIPDEFYEDTQIIN